jgi:hypothetical protein
VTAEPDVSQSYAPLYDRFENMSRLLSDPPLLAHYTSIQTLEKILKYEELWFSNPLFMNDLQEMRFGLNEGARLFSRPELLEEAAETVERAIKLDQHFQYYFTKFDSEAAFDTYVFCVSEHAKEDTDGLLSMWRGYGSHGNGAALIFNPGNVALIPNSILTLATVSYASTEKRLEELNALLQQWAGITKALSLSDEMLHHASYAALSIIKTYALTTKHSGFSEEKEWRIIYLAEQDPNGLLKPYLSHQIGPRGVEPKLKFKIEPIPGVTGDVFNLDLLLHQIILGPSLSSPLAFQGIARMLEGFGKGRFKTRLRASSIPLRATP